MKPDKTYKMSKQLKTLLALMPFPNKETKSAWKKNMIAAEIHAKSVERVMMDR